jgi:exosortase A
VTAVVVGPAAAAPDWRRSALPFLLLLIGIVALYWPTATAMVGIWSRSDTFAHAYVVPFITLWLVWRKRDVLMRISPKPMFWMLPAMAAVALAWLLGEIVAANALAQFALVAMLVLAVPTVFGLEVASVLVFPLAFTFFAVPFGEFAMPQLMQWTADFTIAALRLSGIPVYREGLRFVIPSGSWLVVEACSGVRYLMASFMVGSLFAYLNYRSARRRWIFVGLSLLVPVVANWLRAYMIVMLGHLSSNRIAVGADHLLYGWVFFGVVITVLFMIGARWSEPEERDETRPPSPSAVSTRPQPAWVAALLAAALVALPAGGWRFLDGGAAGAPPPTVVVNLPDAAASGWKVAATEPANWAPHFQGQSATVRRAYVDDAGRRVGVHLVYYRQQQGDRKLVSSVNVAVRADDPAWNAVSVIDRRAGGGLAVRELRLLSTGAMGGGASATGLRVWQLYWINGQWVIGDVRAKLLGAWGRWRGQGDDAAAVFLFAPEGQPGGAESALDGFLRTNEALLRARLDAARVGATAL